MRNASILAFIPLGCLLCIGPAAASGPADAAKQPPGIAALVAKFDELEARSVDMSARLQATNERGELAWGTAPLLEAYLDVFEATRQRAYLDRFARLAHSVVERVDATRGVVDYAGRRRVGWSATKYSRAGERIVWMVHTGMVTFPFTRFALLANNDPSLGGLKPLAGVLRSVSEAAVREFDGAWRYDVVSRTGHYVYLADEPHRGNVSPNMPVPFNQQLALGRTLVLLAQITGQSTYRERAEALARHFKSQLGITSGGYRWTYWYGRGLNLTSAEEDVSHGAIDVEFAVTAAAAGLVFRQRDLEQFRLALFRLTAVRDGVMGAPSDGTGRWLALCEVDCRPYDVLLPHFSAKVDRQHPQVLLGVARLAKYFDVCRGRANSVDPGRA